MTDIVKQFEIASAEFAKLRSILAQTLKLDIDPGTRQYLQSLGTSMDQALADARDAVPKAVAQLDKEIKEAEGLVADTKKDLAEVDAKIAELEATPPPVAPPGPAEPALDPRRGKLLRDELLGRFLPTAAAARAPEGGDVQEMASGDFRSSAEVPKQTSVPRPAATTPPAPPAPPRPPEKKGDKDAWDISSGAWEKDE